MGFSAVALANFVRRFHHERVAHLVERFEHHQHADRVHRATARLLPKRLGAAVRTARAEAAFFEGIADHAANLIHGEDVARLEACGCAAIQRDDLILTHHRVTAHGDDAGVDVGGGRVRNEVHIHIH